MNTFAVKKQHLSDKEKLIKVLGDLYWLTDKVKLWDENNLSEGFKNLSEKQKKEIINYTLHYQNNPDETGFYISENEINCIFSKLDENLNEDVPLYEKLQKYKKTLPKEYSRYEDKSFLSETDTDYGSDESKTKSKDSKTYNILKMKCECKIKNSFCENDICQLPEINQILFTVLNPFDKELANDIKFWPKNKIGKWLYREKQEIIDKFYNAFEICLDTEYNLKTEQIFTSVKGEITKELKKQIGTKKDEKTIKINGIEFLINFDTFRVSTFDKSSNKWCQTYMESKFKYIEMMCWTIPSVHMKVTAEKYDSGYKIIFIYSEHKKVEFILDEWVTFDNIELSNDEEDDDEGIENCSNNEKNLIYQLKSSIDPELWVDNNLVQTICNLNNKIKCIEKQNHKK
jgi:hypothetical protein